MRHLVSVKRAGESNRRLHTELARKHENLQNVMEQLERKNRELEAFSYSVSHDLRAPLRILEKIQNR